MSVATIMAGNGSRDGDPAPTSGKAADGSATIGSGAIRVQSVGDSAAEVSAAASAEAADAVKGIAAGAAASIGGSAGATVGAIAAQAGSSAAQRVIAAGGTRMQAAAAAEAAAQATATAGAIMFDANESGEVCDWANSQVQRVVYELVAVLFESKRDSIQVRDETFKRVCDIIRDRHADLSLAPSVIAAEAGMSLRKLQALFTRRGLTCTGYLQSVRLEHASFLIRRREFLGTKELLRRISFDCGYRDYNYFVRLFRRKFGQSPSEYARSRRDRS